MSYERDQGRFDPEDGDIVSILGSFNDWEPGVDQLQDPEGDWIFEIELKEIPDTLEFKFAMTSEVNLDLPNAGLEIIPNRRLARTVIENDTPVLTSRFKFEVQQLLNFFIAFFRGFIVQSFSWSVV